MPYVSRSLVRPFTVLSGLMLASCLSVSAQAQALTPSKKTASKAQSKTAKPPSKAMPVSAAKAGAAVPPGAWGKVGTVKVPPPPNAVLFNKGIQAYGRGNDKEAERIFRQLTRMEPGEPANWADLGLVLNREKKYDEAITVVRKATALAETSKDPKVRQNRGRFQEQLARLYATRQRWPECAETVRRALNYGSTSDPDMLTALLGLALLKQKKYAEAIPVLEKRKCFPGETVAVPEERLVLALSESGRSEEAIKLMQSLIGRYPKEPRYPILLADIAAKAGNKKLQGDAWTQAYALNPHDLRAGENAAVAATMRGDRNGALMILRQLAVIYPDNPGLHFQIGTLLYTNPGNSPEQFAAAEKELLAAAVRDPKNSDCVAMVGLAIMMQDNPARRDTAANYLKSALKQNPHLDMARLGLANIAEKNSKPDAAVVQYRTVIQSSHDPAMVAQAHRRLAAVLYSVDKKDEAYQEYETLIAMFPENDPRGNDTLSRLASLLLNDGKLKEAEAAYGRLTRRSPQDPQAYIGLGQALERQGKRTEAGVQYAQAATIAPKDDTAVLLEYNLLESNKTAAIVKRDHATADRKAAIEKNDQAEADKQAALIKQYQAEADRHHADADALLQKQIDADPQGDHNQTRWQLAGDLEDAGRIDDGLKILSGMTLRRNDPNRTANLLARSQMMLRHKRAAEALTELTALAAENRDVDELRYALAEAQEQSGKPEAAEKTLMETVARHAANPRDSREGRLRLADLLEREGKLNEAAGKFEEVLQLDPVDTRALPGLNTVRAKQGKSEAVGEFLETGALSNDHEPSEAWVKAVEQQYRQANQTARWVAFTKRLAERYPHNRAALRRRIAALLPDGLNRLDDFKEIETLAGHIVELDSSDAWGHYYLGRVRETQGRKPEAIAEYTKAVQAAPQFVEASAALHRLGGTLPDLKNGGATAPPTQPKSAATAAPAPPTLPTPQAVPTTKPATGDLPGAPGQAPTVSPVPPTPGSGK